VVTDWSTPVRASVGAPGSRKRSPLALPVLCLAQFMVVLDVAIVNIALPTIQKSLHVKPENLQWVVIAYGLTLGGFLLLGGRCADLLGRRVMLIMGITIFTVGSMACGLSHSIGPLIAFRAVQGFGSAFTAPAALSSLTSIFPEGPERAKALGIWGAVGAGGGSLGVLLGGAITNSFGWKWIFFINVPIGVLLVASALLVLPESRGEVEHRTFDVAGALSITGGVVLVVYAVNRSIDHPWTTGITAGCAIAGIVLLAIALLVESHVKAPLVDLTMFRKRTVAVADSVGLLVFGSLFAMAFLLSLYMQEVLGYSPLKAGLAYLPLTMSVIVGAGLASVIVTRVGPKPVIGVGMTFVAVGLFLLSHAPVGGHYTSNLLPGFLIAALGAGLSVVPIQVSAFAGVSEDEAGMAAGLINTAQEVGGAVMVAIVATIAVSTSRHYATSHRAPLQLLQVQSLDHGLRTAFVVASGLAVLAVLAVVALLPGAASAGHPPSNAHHTIRPLAIRPISHHRSHHWGHRPPITDWERAVPVR
jgi:EmrB/QacA subfamily drug resistance transporter